MNTRKQKIPILIQMGMAAAGLTSDLSADQFTRGETLSDDFWKEGEGQDIAASMEKTLHGIQKYVNAEPLDIERPETIWQQGETKLRRYASTKPKTHAHILIIPSLINGYEIVDLHPERSFARYLADSGFEVLIIDWGDLKHDPDLQNFESIITRRFAAITEFLSHKKKPIFGIGYCMGGILLAAADLLYPKIFKALSFIATPWDFTKDTKGNFAEQLLNWLKDGMAKMQVVDYIPADWLQMIFMGVDPAQIARKFSAFAEMNEDDLNTEIFVKVEDWVNNGPDIPSQLLIESTNEWYKNNRIYKGEWRVGGIMIDARNIVKPCHVTIPTRDKIVPPASSEPLANQLSNSILLKADGGHISLMMGRNAEVNLWRPLTAFFMMHCGNDKA